MSNYTTKEACQDYLENDIDPSHDARIATYLTAMTRHIDNVVGYKLYTDQVTESLYDGSGRRVQVVDPVHGITAVEIGDEALSPLPTLWPYNEPVKTELRFDLRYWPQGTANIKVTGKHSLCAELPPDIVFAATVLTSLILVQVRDQSDGLQSEKIGDYQVSFRDKKDRIDFDQAMSIIKHYRPIAV